jgi:hypothetical protein
MQLSMYNYYDGTETDFAGIENCGVHSADCKLMLTVWLTSTMVNTQQSKRGTDPLSIFIDEGGIIGGLQFLTWFLEIFAV